MALLSKDDLKAELNLTATDTEYDALLVIIAAAVQSLFDELAGITTEETEHTEYFNGKTYQQKVFLKNTPVKVDTISVWDDPDWVYDDALSSADVKVDLVNGIVYYNSYFSEGFQNIKVTYTAGYTSLTFPSGWKQVWVRQGCVLFNEAKSKEWGVQAITYGTGYVARRAQKDGLLPEFQSLITFNDLKG